MHLLCTPSDSCIYFCVCVCVCVVLCVCVCVCVWCCVCEDADKGDKLQ